MLYPIEKRISIVYNESDFSTAENIYTTLIELGFLSVTKCPLNLSNSIDQYYNDWFQSMPQLAITINLAGFDWRNSGGNTMYSMLGFNTFHYIDTDLGNESKLLFGLLPITMRFITDTRERCERIDATYDRIHDISFTSDVSKTIPEMLTTLDWRK